ncbi:MAG: glycosyltransferase [Candidatus Bathycorpusculaceae bacterium]
MLLFDLLEFVLLAFFLFVFGWTVYNLPVLLVGVRQVWRKTLVGRGSINAADASAFGLPFFSLIVPMRNERKVAERILEALMRLDYPCDGFEVLVVEDGSVDGTLDICRRYERIYPGRIRVFHRDFSPGKPSALNFALQFAKGDLIGVFDADNLPERDVLRRAAEHFRSSRVVALQGLLSSINADENMLTRFIHYENILQYFAFFAGRDALGLFVPLAGTCQFLRRSVLDEVGGWSEGALAEDMELAARLTEKGYRVRFASDVRCLQENPSSFRQLVGQRARWFRGCMDVAVKYGRLLGRFDRRSLDAEIFFSGPFVMVLFLLMQIMGVYALFVPFNLGVYTGVLSHFTSAATLLALFLLGVGLAYASRPRRVSNVKWLPFIYLYWATQVFVAFYAFLQIVFRRPAKWTGTSHTGAVTK